MFNGISRPLPPKIDYRRTRPLSGKGTRLLFPLLGDRTSRFRFVVRWDEGDNGIRLPRFLRSDLRRRLVFKPQQRLALALGTIPVVVGCHQRRKQPRWMWRPLRLSTVAKVGGVNAPE